MAISLLSFDFDDSLVASYSFAIWLKVGFVDARLSTVRRSSLKAGVALEWIRR